MNSVNADDYTDMWLFYGEGDQKDVDTALIAENINQFHNKRKEVFCGLNWLSRKSADGRKSQLLSSHAADVGDTTIFGQLNQFPDSLYVHSHNNTFSICVFRTLVKRTEFRLEETGTLSTETNTLQLAKLEQLVKLECENPTECCKVFFKHCNQYNLAYADHKQRLMGVIDANTCYLCLDMEKKLYWMFKKGPKKRSTPASSSQTPKKNSKKPKGDSIESAIDCTDSS